MLGMWFTFGADAECLGESVKAFRTTFPDHKICICDDPKNPLSKENIDYINPDHYELRDWDSRGNLNGWQAVKGILSFQMKMHDFFPDYHGALKVDCDTLILDSSWIDKESPISGFDLGTHSLIAGMARYLRKDVPKALLDEFEARWQWQTAGVPEDTTIAIYCFKLFGNECNSILWRDGALSYSYVNPEINEKPCKVITFGNRQEIKGCANCDKRSIVGMNMAKFLKFRHENTNI